MPKLSSSEETAGNNLGKENEKEKGWFKEGTQMLNLSEFKEGDIVCLHIELSNSVISQKFRKFLIPSVRVREEPGKSGS